MGTEALVKYVYASKRACNWPFYMENGRVGSAPSLYRESTDSLTSKKNSLKFEEDVGMVVPKHYRDNCMQP